MFVHCNVSGSYFVSVLVTDVLFYIESSALIVAFKNIVPEGTIRPHGDLYYFNCFWSIENADVGI